MRPSSHPFDGHKDHRLNQPKQSHPNTRPMGSIQTNE